MQIALLLFQSYSFEMPIEVTTFGINMHNEAGASLRV